MKLPFMAHISPWQNHRAGDDVIRPRMRLRMIGALRDETRFKLRATLADYLMSTEDESDLGKRIEALLAPEEHSEVVSAFTDFTLEQDAKSVPEASVRAFGVGTILWLGLRWSV
jgi:hypothetical protein